MKYLFVLKHTETSSFYTRKFWKLFKAIHFHCTISIVCFTIERRNNNTSKRKSVDNRKTKDWEKWYILKFIQIDIKEGRHNISDSRIENCMKFCVQRKKNQTHATIFEWTASVWKTTNWIGKIMILYQSDVYLNMNFHIIIVLVL